jgi:hypothetical protein
MPPDERIVSHDKIKSIGCSVLNAGYLLRARADYSDGVFIAVSSSRSGLVTGRILASFRRQVRACVLADQERLWDELEAKETVLPEALSARLASPN